MAERFYSAALEQLGALQINKFETDSRKIVPGDVFVCREGITLDSHSYAEEAVIRGAVGLISNKPLKTAVPCVQTPAFSVSVSLISQFYQYPQDKLFNIGVTGTNGKTTVAYSLQQLLNKTTPSAYTGTLGCQFDGYSQALENTTPDAVSLLSMMWRMTQSGITHHVMEVSSHALDQDRVSIINFDMIIITNLGEDHLDYHGNRNDYIHSKLRLIDRLKLGGTAVVNADDPVAPAILDRCRGKCHVVTFGSSEPWADFFADQVVTDSSGSQYQLNHGDLTVAVQSPLPFTFNVENSLAVLTALSVINGEVEKAADLLKTLQTIPGRSEVSRTQTGASIVVDYAHNLDSIQHLLANVREHTRGRILMVLGVTGERVDDAADIGQLCSKLSELCWFTADNPLNVPLEDLLSEMVSLADQSRCFKVKDRADAISKAFTELSAGDCLLICGKGRETWQYINNDKLSAQPYEGDHQVVARLLEGKQQVTGS